MIPANYLPALFAVAPVLLAGAVIFLAAHLPYRVNRARFERENAGLRLWKGRRS